MVEGLGGVGAYRGYFQPPIFETYKNHFSKFPFSTTFFFQGPSFQSKNLFQTFIIIHLIIVIVFVGL